MADETKTYLVNVESNLKKYAEEAAAAKKQVDALTKSTKALKKAGLENTAEYQQQIAQLKNAKTEYTNLQKVVQAGLQLQSKELSYRQQLTAARTIEIQNIKNLGSGLIKDAEGRTIVNSKLVESKQRLADINKALIEHDQSLNSGATNVGRYGEAVNAAFKQGAASIMSMISPMALVAAGIAAGKKLFDGLKDAIMSTTDAINFFNISGAITKQIFFDITHGGLNVNNLIEVAKATDELNKVRTEGYLVEAKISKLDLELQKEWFAAKDLTKTKAEQTTHLTKVEELENQKIAMKVKHLEKEYDATVALSKVQPTEENMKRILAITSQIAQVKSEEFSSMKRVESTRTGNIAKEEKQLEDLLKSIRKAADEQVEINAETLADEEKLIEDENILMGKRAEKRKEIADKELAAEENLVEEESILMGKRATKRKEDAAKRTYDDAKAGIELARMKIRNAKDGFDQLQLLLDKEYIIYKNSAEFKLLTDNQKLVAEQKYTDAKIQLTKLRQQAELRELELTADIFGSLSELSGKQTVANKAFAIAQALINTYLAGVKAMAELPIGAGPVLRFLTLAAVIAAGLVQVKNILAVDTSGKTAAAIPSAISSAAPTQKAYASQVGSTVLNQPVLTQAQLNTLPNQNLLTAADIANALKNMPAPIVTVEDINAKIRDVQKVNVRANI
jgi:hypothetical protein